MALDALMTREAERFHAEHPRSPAAAEADVGRHTAMLDAGAAELTSAP
jgi:hypothetical protein